MTKSDKSIYNVCIAAIKRTTFKPYNYKWARFYESNLDFEDAYPEIQLNFAENELIICSTIISLNNFSILTTQKLITKEEGVENSGSLLNAIDKRYGDFKGGFNDDPYTFGLVQLQNGSILKYFIEIGKASMIMIYGVRTLITLQQMTNTQVGNLTKIWNRKNDI